MPQTRTDTFTRAALCERGGHAGLSALTNGCIGSNVILKKYFGPFQFTLHLLSLSS